MKNDRRGRPDSVKVIRVIQVTTIQGEGTVQDPVRQYTLYYSLDGKLLAEDDSIPCVLREES